MSFVDRKLQYYETVFLVHRDHFSQEFQSELNHLLAGRRKFLNLRSRESGSQSNEDLEGFLNIITDGVRLIEEDGFNEIRGQLSDKLALIGSLAEP